MSGEDAKAAFSAAAVLMDMADAVLEQNPPDGSASFAIIKQMFDDINTGMKKTAVRVKEQMNNALLFCEKAFGSGNEIVILITEMTANRDCARFISRYGCEQYFRFNKELLISERQNEMLQEISNLNLD